MLKLFSVTIFSTVIFACPNQNDVYMFIFYFNKKIS